MNFNIFTKKEGEQECLNKSYGVLLLKHHLLLDPTAFAFPYHKMLLPVGFHCLSPRFCHNILSLFFIGHTTYPPPKPPTLTHTNYKMGCKTKSFNTLLCYHNYCYRVETMLPMQFHWVLTRELFYNNIVPN